MGMFTLRISIFRVVRYYGFRVYTGQLDFWKLVKLPLGLSSLFHLENSSPMGAFDAPF